MIKFQVWILQGKLCFYILLCRTLCFYNILWVNNYLIWAFRFSSKLLGLFHNIYNYSLSLYLSSVSGALQASASHFTCNLFYLLRVRVVVIVTFYPDRGYHQATYNQQWGPYCHLTSHWSNSRIPSMVSAF